MPPLTTRPVGTKKLVPRWRSQKRRSTAARRAEKAVRASPEVTNQAHTVSGRRIMVMPRPRHLSGVAIRLMDWNIWAKQKIPMLVSQRSMAVARPGPAEARAESGGYAVQPAVGAPPVTKNDASMRKKARRVVQKEREFRRGNAMRRSGAAICSGRTRFAKTPMGAVVRTKKTIREPWMVSQAR